MKISFFLLVLIFPLMTMGQVTDEKTKQNLLKLLNNNSVNQTLYQGNPNELKHKAKNKTTNCSATDPSCQGFNIGSKLKRTSSVTINKNIATKQCTAYSEPVLERKSYSCIKQKSSSKNTCPSKLPQQCSISNKTCTKHNANSCVQEKIDYVCERYKITKLNENCSPQDCTDTNCPSKKSNNNSTDLNNSLALLETGRQIVKYFDPNDTKIFEGTRSECRYKVAWGLSNCCRSSNSGRTNNKYALAQLGVSHAIRNVSTIGNPHTHDILFLTEDLQKGVAGLGQGKLFSTFSPSLSYYGLNISLTKGVITFGFDPTSFAVAVALAVIANLIKCDQHEKVLGMRIGAGLCYGGHRWCSKRRWFTCKERKQSFCCYNSKLAKTISSQGKRQLNIDQNHCGGFTQEQINKIDFDQIDLSEVVNDFNTSVNKSILNDYVNNNKKITKQKVKARQ